VEFPSSSELTSTTKSFVRKSEFARNFHYPGTGGGEPGHRAGCASLGARTRGDDLAGDEPISAQPRSARANQLKILSVENRQRAIVPLRASDHRSPSRARNATLDTTHSHDHRTSAPSPSPCYGDRLSCALIPKILSADCADYSQSRGRGTQRWTERILTILTRLHPRQIPAM
jgi:hypothetical protein